MAENINDWQPIETAPRDGTQVLLFGEWAGEIHGRVHELAIYVGSWSRGMTDYPGFDWDVSGGDAYATWCKATHWMPLPVAPVEAR